MNEYWNTVSSILEDNNLGQAFDLAKQGSIAVDAFMRDGGTLQTNAVRQGRISLVRALVDELKADINQGDRNGWSPQYVACYCGDIDMARNQLAWGACSISQSADRSEPLYIACREGHLDLVDLLVSISSVDVNKVDSYGRSAQWVAVHNGHLSVVQRQVAQGADQTVSDIEGYSIAYIAVIRGHASILRYLVDHCKVSLRDLCTSRPNRYIADCWHYIHFACKYGRLGIVEYIYRQYPQSIHMNTAVGGKSPLFIASEEGHAEVVAVLLSFGANVNWNVRELGTSQHIACQKGHLQVVQKQCDDVRVKLDVRDQFERTALHVAVHSGHYEVTRLQQSYGFDPNARTRVGRTPQYLACQRSHVALTELLLEHGACVDAWTSDGCSPLVHAAKTGHTPLVKMLQRSKRDYCTHVHVVAALRHNHFDVARLLLQRGGSAVTMHGREGSSLLYDVVRAEHTELSRLQLTHQADPNASSRSGKSVLHLAVGLGNVSIVQSLLEHKADHTVLSKYGKTPLYVAVIEGHVGVVDILQLHKADITTIPDGMTSTLLHTATSASTQCALTIELLLSHHYINLCNDKNNNT